jgi:hypothetical protein
MSKIEVMTPEQRLEAVKAKYYRDHIPADGREQLLVMHDGTIPAPVSRQDGGDNGEPGVMIIDGYGAVFNRDSLDLGFTERIAPGAFDKTVAEDDILGLFNHDRNMVLGRTSAKTMRLKIDDVGVKYEIDAPNTRLDVTPTNPSNAVTLLDRHFHFKPARINGNSMMMVRQSHAHCWMSKCLTWDR